MRHIVVHAGALVVGLAWLYKATEIAAHLFRRTDGRPAAWAVDLPVVLLASGPLLLLYLFVMIRRQVRHR